MIGDIGIIGFTTELRIIDLAGLVSPVSLAQENGKRVSFGRLVELSSPDIICLQDNPLNADSIRWTSSSSVIRSRVAEARISRVVLSDRSRVGGVPLRIREPRLSKVGRHGRQWRFDGNHK